MFDERFLEELTRRVVRKVLAGQADAGAGGELPPGTPGAGSPALPAAGTGGPGFLRTGGPAPEPAPEPAPCLVADDGRLLRGYIDLGAARMGFCPEACRVPGELREFIDHTLLKPAATREDVERLCREAAEYGFAAVCVNPMWVPVCAGLLRSSGVGVCTVVGFPLGASETEITALETRRAVQQGATEIDMVIPIGALRGGDLRAVFQDIAAVRRESLGLACLKVIIETALLDDRQKVAACTLCLEAGADYVKTSTGFAGGGATVADVRLMRAVVGEGVGVKAAGGIKDRADADAMIAAGANRIGASAGVKIVGG